MDILEYILNEQLEAEAGQWSILCSIPFMWSDREICSVKGFEEIIRKIIRDDSSPQKEAVLEKIKVCRGRPNSAKEQNLLIKNILFRGVRKFAGGNEFYCIQPGKNNGVGSCPSVVYLGSNGVGKSSIFYAIEKASLGYARSMTGDKKDIGLEEKYLKHFSSPERSEHFNIIINCCGGLNLKIQKLTDNSDYTTPVFFVSNQDIERLINDQSYIQYAWNHIGMSNFLNLFTAFTNIVVETDSRYEEYEILKARMETLDPDSEEYEKISKSITELAEKYPLLVNDELKNEVRATREMFISQMIDYVKDADEICKVAFKTLFGMYCRHEVTGLDVKVSGNYSIDFDLILRSKTSNIGAIDPIRYLNSFRQKMFCIIYNIAMAFISMKLYGIRFPIIFDDVFNAGDFENKEALNRFIKKIYCVYDELFPGDPVPLQLIFFTQDDLIAHTVYRGMTEVQGDVDDTDPPCPKVNARLCRIFEVGEITDNDKIQSDIDNLVDTIRNEYEIDHPFSIYSIEDQIASNYE